MLTHALALNPTLFQNSQDLACCFISFSKTILKFINFILYMTVLPVPREARRGLEQGLWAILRCWESHQNPVEHQRKSLTTELLSTAHPLISNNLKHFLSVQRDSPMGNNTYWANMSLNPQQSQTAKPRQHMPANSCRTDRHKWKLGVCWPTVQPAHFRLSERPCLREVRWKAIPYHTHLRTNLSLGSLKHTKAMVTCEVTLWRIQPSSADAATASPFLDNDS